MVAQVYDHFHEMAHAVLYDEDVTARKNDGNYYFKNSYPAVPYIIVPKDRVTYNQYEMLKRTRSRQQYQYVLQQWQQKIGQNISANLHPTAAYWTIYDFLYAISIEKI